MNENNENRVLKIACFSLIVLAVILAIVDIVLFLNKKPASTKPNTPIAPPVAEALPDILEYEYADDSIPGTEYKIKLNYDTGALYVYAHYFCSAVDCPGQEAEYTTLLTDDEVEKIKIITNDENYDKEILSEILEDLALGDEVFAEVSNVDYDEKIDLNKDGVVTQREFGNYFLDVVIEELEL